MSSVGARVGVVGTDVVGKIRAALSVVGRRRGSVVRPQPPATPTDGNSRSCENAE
jgi:hypothetical protein